MFHSSLALMDMLMLTASGNYYVVVCECVRLTGVCCNKMQMIMLPYIFDHLFYWYFTIIRTMPYCFINGLKNCRLCCYTIVLTGLVSGFYLKLQV